MQKTDEDREWNLHVATCRIDLWRGYLVSSFFAVPDDGAEADAVVEPSSTFSWRSSRPPDSQEARLAHYELLSRLKAAGWTPTGQGEEWYETELSRPMLVPPTEPSEELEGPEEPEEPESPPVAAAPPPPAPPPPVAAAPRPVAAAPRPVLAPAPPAAERTRPRDRWQAFALVGLLIAAALLVWALTHA